MEFNNFKNRISNNSPNLKRIKIFLSSNFRPPIKVVILPFREHIIHNSDREQIKLREGQPDLHTSEKEQGRCHRTVSFAMFF